MISLPFFAPASTFTLFLFGLALIFILLTIFSLNKTEYVLYALLIWFPLETFILRYTAPEYYGFVKYLPEVLIYSTLIISWLRYIKRTSRFFPSTPLNIWLVVFILVAFVSLVLNNFYSITIWFFGLRQILRFLIIFFIVLFEDYTHDVIKNFLIIGICVVVGEAVLGVLQYAFGGALDKYLFFTDTITVGNFQVGAIEANWAPGQRVFATLGRYDRLGSLLVVGLLMLFPWLYNLKSQVTRERWWLGFIIGTLALVLTYSRANWLAFLVGMFVIGHFILRDKRVLKILVSGVVIVGAYLLFVIFTQSFGTGAVDITGAKQSLRDRLVESVSFYSWQQGYEGYGRIFFIINTPLMVVRHYPLFGVGPGNYGGGVAASLLNTKVYDKLHLPFGIQNTYGQIDNNWLSIWGEYGTLGLLAWAFLLIAVYRSAYFVHQKSDSVVQRTVAEGLCGTTVAVAVLGFFGPYFEFRTLMVYFWLIVGVALFYFREHSIAWNFLREPK